jgi:hypothetical protein
MAGSSSSRVVSDLSAPWLASAAIMVALKLPCVPTR